MDDRRIEIIIGNLLRFGVLLAAGVVLVGGGMYLVHNHARHVGYGSFLAGGEETRTLGGIIGSAMHLNSEGLIQLGLVLLIATPIARVAFAVIGFAMERDRLYTVVSLIVLAILAFSLLHAA